MVVTGVRWAESANRAKTHGAVDLQNKPKATVRKAKQMGATYQLNKQGEVIMNDDNDANRKMVESCYRTQKTMVNPIVDWSDEDVWEFLNSNNIPHCSLYDEGFTRLGCIGCPLAGAKNMQHDFERWPKYKENYIRAFQRMIDSHPGQIKVLDKDYKPKNVYCSKAELTDTTVPKELSGGGYGSTSGSGCTCDGPGPKTGAGGIQPLDRNGSHVVPPEKIENGSTKGTETGCSDSGSKRITDTPPEKFTRYGSTRQTDGWTGGCRKADGLVVYEYELTTPETVLRWWTEHEAENRYLIFTLDSGQTWQDKEEDIKETIRRRWEI